MYSYVDPCTKETKFITVDMNSPIVVVYYNQVRTFSYTELQDGTFDLWMADIYNKYKSTSPCQGAVATKRNASAASIVLSAGTGSVAGVAITPLVVFAVPSSVTATVITVAFAGATATMPKVMAATMASAIFLNEFIRSFSLLY